MNKNKSFWHQDIEPGYYDKIIQLGLEKNKGLQSNWHNCTYKNVLDLISNSSNNLDYACGSGTFIGRYLQSKATGVDIALEQVNYARSKFKDKNFYTVEEFNNLNLEEKFSSILTRDDYPDRFKQIQKTCESLNLIPSDVTMIGDRIHDINSANQANCKSILVNRDDIDSKKLIELINILWNQ